MHPARLVWGQLVGAQGMLSNRVLWECAPCPIPPCTACFKTRALGGAVAELWLSLACGWPLKEGEGLRSASLLDKGKRTPGTAGTT